MRRVLVLRKRSLRVLYHRKRPIDENYIPSWQAWKSQAMLDSTLFATRSRSQRPCIDTAVLLDNEYLTTNLVTRLAAALLRISSDLVCGSRSWIS